MIKTLSLDLWDTIIRDEPGLVESYALMKLEAFWKVISNYKRVSFREVVESYKKVMHYKGYVPPLHFARILAASLGLDPTSIAAEEAARAYEEASYKYTPVLVPGAKELILRAKSLGLKVVVVSNTSFSARAVERILCNASLCGVLDYVASSSELGLMKPNPLIFLRALEAVGSEPSEAIHVGDSCFNDVLGALLAGIKPVLHNPSSSEVACPGVRGLVVVRNLAEVADMLEKLMAETRGG